MDITINIQISNQNAKSQKRTFEDEELNIKITKKIKLKKNFKSTE